MKHKTCLISYANKFEDTRRMREISYAVNLNFAGRCFGVEHSGTRLHRPN